MRVIIFLPLVALFAAASHIRANAQALETLTGLQNNTSIALPFEASLIIPGPDGTVLVVSERDRLLSFVDPRAEQRFEVISLPGKLLAVETGPTFDNLTAAAAATEGSDGSVAITYVGTLGPESQSGLISRRDTLEEAQLELKAPSIAFFNRASDPGSWPSFVSSGVVLWDKSLLRANDDYVILNGGDLIRVRPYDYPSEMIRVGDGTRLLGLHSSTGRLSVIDPLTGRFEDSISVESFEAANPSDLEVLGPLGDEADSAIVFNQSTRRLTVVSVRFLRTSGQLPARPRLDEPISIDVGGDGEGYLAATRDLSLILVGEDGQSVISAFQQVKGGIDRLPSIQLEVPQHGFAMVSGRSPFEPEVFVYLSRDGRSLNVMDLASLSAQSQLSSAHERPSGDEANLVPGPLNRLSQSSLIGLQRLLSVQGYQIGAIDGRAGPRTESALRAFQFDQNLDVTGTLTSDTIYALEAAIMENEPGLSPDILARYTDFLADALGPVSAISLLTLGSENEDLGSLCFGSNTPPPAHLWPYSVPFAKILRELQSRMSFPIEVISGYRSDAYSRCAADQESLNHSRFLAFDIKARSDESDGSSRSTLALLTAIEELEAEGFSSVDTLVMGDLVHVSPTIGEWQAVVATYDRTSRGCHFARNDLEEISRLLAGTELAGREISIAARTDRDHYVVTVSTHNDREAAEAGVAIIQAAAAKSSDGRTGSDAYVRQSDFFSWNVDCLGIRVIPE